MSEAQPLEGIIVNNEDIVTFPVNGLPDANQLRPLWTVDGAVEPIVVAIETLVRSMDKPDVKTKKGQAQIASLAYKIAQAKSKLEKFGKELADDSKNIPKRIDANRKLIKDRLEALQDEVRAELTAYEEELLRLKSKLEAIKANAPSFMDRTEAQLVDRLEALKAMTITPHEWNGLFDDAIAARATSVSVVTAMLEERKKYDAEQAELEALRIKEQERLKAEREAEIARKAAEEATRSAEERAQAESDRALRLVAEAEAAKLAAQQAQADSEARARATEALAAQQAEEARLRGIAEENERRRLEQERLDKEQADRDADVEHRRVINREALKDITEALSEKHALFHDTANDAAIEEAAVHLLKAIITGKIKHVRITY